MLPMIIRENPSLQKLIFTNGDKAVDIDFFTLFSMILGGYPCSPLQLEREQSFVSIANVTNAGEGSTR